MASDTDPFVVSSLAKDYAIRLGFDSLAAAHVALVAGELASNCWRHGGGGYIELRSTDEGLEIWAVDRGPGIEDLVSANEDGYSRGRRHTPETPVRDSLGSGLGTVRRLMDDVEVHSETSRGTTVIARKRLPGGQ